ncbi:SRPBCC family protein [Pedobacter sp. ASV12]|uniref:SRPBCC family protein n=1 Tax=Pedobacter sp. ASV12 TaxID=2795120 RepID=UPI0018EE1413|nr:SRPBCC family protein [Pedobacter sp. ASV12]
MEKVVIIAQMLIRKPAREVLEAFIDPAITTKFWFTKSSGKLEEGKTVTWEWEMYNVSNEVSVKEIIVDKKIATQWGQPATNVDYEFTAVSADSTYVEIKSYGFNLDTDELIKAVMDNTGGFTTVLDGAKAYLEHGIQLNLVGDKFPHR